MKFSHQLKQSLLTALLSSIFTFLILFLGNYSLNRSWNLFAGKSSIEPFTVQGTASISQKPDSATIYFMVAKTAPTLKEAQKQANTATNTLVIELKKLGILEKDIKTTNYNSNPVYATNNTVMIMPVRGDGAQKITGYSVSENIEVLLSDITKANNVIDTLTKNGAENISDPNITFSDVMQKNLMQQARIKAINDAKSKAKDLAHAAGIRLGRILSVREVYTPSPIQPLMMKDSVAQTAPTNIQPGENTVTATVFLSYETW